MLDVYKKRGIIVNDLNWFFKKATDDKFQNDLTKLNESNIFSNHLYDKQLFKLAYKRTLEILQAVIHKTTLLELLSELITQYKNIVLDQLKSKEEK